MYGVTGCWVSGVYMRFRVRMVSGLGFIVDRDKFGDLGIQGRRSI